jgi:hypothetical protein
MDGPLDLLRLVWEGCSPRPRACSSTLAATSLSDAIASRTSCGCFDKALIPTVTGLELRSGNPVRHLGNFVGKVAK